MKEDLVPSHSLGASPGEPRLSGTALYEAVIVALEYEREGKSRVIRGGVCRDMAESEAYTNAALRELCDRIAEPAPERGTSSNQKRLEEIALRLKAVNDQALPWPDASELQQYALDNLEDAELVANAPSDLEWCIDYIRELEGRLGALAPGLAATPSGLTVSLRCQFCGANLEYAGHRSTCPIRSGEQV